VPNAFHDSNVDYRQEMALIQANLEIREQSIRESIARYHACGERFQRIADEYLALHSAVVQCEKEIDRLLHLQSTSGSR
jgi:hypothetical protein